MTGAAALRTVLLPGSRALLDYHAAELPQRDDLCGAFCGALALNAAGIAEARGEPADQDAVALAAGSIVSTTRDPATLPGGKGGRRDYRLAIPTIDDPDVSGTTAEGVARAIDELGGGAVTAIPYHGPWTPETLDGLFDAAAGLSEPVTLIANLATHHLWGAGATPAQLLAHLCDGSLDGPPPDWDVGHFSCVVACTEGPGGRLYAVADTYPALGDHGVHLQPRERLAAAIARVDKPAGGVLAVVSRGEAERLRDAAHALGLAEGLWDNGTVTERAA
ncbi:MAG TPA: hypothetical protein VN618_12960 [Solirubrobacteraceae bacterium]|nr:hypothetical protein [Solirubrobacteraceae bacterium]